MSFYGPDYDRVKACVEAGQSWRNIVAATCWNHPSVNPPDELISAVDHYRDLVGCGQLDPVDAAMGDETAKLFPEYVGRIIGAITVRPTIKRGRIILSCGDKPDQWIQVLE